RRPYPHREVAPLVPLRPPRRVIGRGLFELLPDAVHHLERAGMSFDVITLGEAMVRLSPPNFRRLEQARSLDVQVGGAELNTAVALARLGRSAAWVSRLTSNPLGRLIANHAREAGVSTDHILWTNDDRVGVY